METERNPLRQRDAGDVAARQILGIHNNEFGTAFAKIMHECDQPARILFRATSLADKNGFPCRPSRAVIECGLLSGF